VSSIFECIVCALLLACLLARLPACLFFFFLLNRFFSRFPCGRRNSPTWGMLPKAVVTAVHDRYSILLGVAAPAGSIPSFQTFSEALPTIRQVLTCLSHHLSNDLILFSKICRYDHSNISAD
jgi:hypothetical protein